MNIVNIMLSSEKGGLEQMSVIYGKAMAEMGHKVKYIITRDSAYKDDIQSSGGEIYYITSRSRYNLWSIYQTIKFIEQEKTDIVICHGNRAMSIVLNKYIRKLIHTHYKTIGVMHSEHCPYLEKCDKLIFLTKNAFLEQSKAIQRKSYILPNTILENSHRIRSLHSPIVFGALGRLHAVKGFDILVRALSLLKQEHKECYLVIGGTGPEEKKILHIIKKMHLEKEIEMLGWVTRKQDFFDKIDIFVLPSRQERLGLVLLEAFAYSKAVISTECIGPKEILNQLKSPLLVPCNDEEQLARAMSDLMEDKEKIKKMAQEGNALYCQKYNKQAFKEKLSQILKEVYDEIN